MSSKPQGKMDMFRNVKRAAVQKVLQAVRSLNAWTQRAGLE